MKHLVGETMSYLASDIVRCWCTSSRLTRFSEHYLRCDECGTLVVASMPNPEDLQVADDNEDFYGRDYWLSHQERDYNQPNIYQRVRRDLPERCLHWLRTLLKYKLPPGHAIELGSAHGGFVAMMQWAGFEAIGLELSTWVVDFARQTFDVPMVLGPIEEQDFEKGSFDIIAMMDVLEHLPDPVKTMRRCAELLKPNGILLVQTPCFRGGTETYEKLLTDNDPFVRAQLKETEHLFLFTEESARLLMERVGCPYVVFEPAIFVYDMFLVASKAELDTVDPKDLDKAMMRLPSARLIRAIMDQDDRIKELLKRVDEIESDRQERLQIIARLNRHIEETSADYQARLRVIQDQQATIAKQQKTIAAQRATITEQQTTIAEIKGNFLVRLLQRIGLI